MQIDSSFKFQLVMFARKIKVEYQQEGHRQACPLKWLDNFSMRNFTNDAVFDDTLPIADGLMEVGTRVPPRRPTVQAPLPGLYCSAVTRLQGERALACLGQPHQRATQACALALSAQENYGVPAPPVRASSGPGGPALAHRRPQRHP